MVSVSGHSVCKYLSAQYYQNQGGQLQVRLIQLTIDMCVREVVCLLQAYRDLQWGIPEMTLGVRHKE
jgi:hypothetical protein